MKILIRLNKEAILLTGKGVADLNAIITLFDGAKVCEREPYSSVKSYRTTDDEISMEIVPDAMVKETA